VPPVQRCSFDGGGEEEKGSKGKEKGMLRAPSASFFRWERKKKKKKKGGRDCRKDGKKNRVYFFIFLRRATALLTPRAAGREGKEILERERRGGKVRGTTLLRR